MITFQFNTTVRFWGSIRILITFMAFLGNVVHFSQKASTSIALVCMVNHSVIEHPKLSNTGANHTTFVDEGCLRQNKSNHIDGPFIWNRNIQGIILCSYFVGFTITQIPGGYFACRYGARFIFGGAVFVSSLASICVPLAASTHWILFCILQILGGLAHGTIWPSIIVIMAHWVPSKERGRLMSFVNIGTGVGIILILSTGGVMCSQISIGGWRLIYYFTGLFGFLWAIAWLIIYTDSPATHPFISATEKRFLLENIQQVQDKNNVSRFRAPWKAILTSPACWALFTIHICSHWGTLTFFTSVPKYMDEVLGFDIKSNGLLSSSLYVSQCLFINISGIISDMLIHKKVLSITQTRKLFNVLGVFLPAMFAIGLLFITCETKYIAAVLLALIVGLNGCYIGGGFVLVANDMAPAYAGIIFGISNTFATVSGILSPYLAGVLTEKDPDNWKIVFLICIIIYCIGIITFLLIGSAELQHWAIKHEENPNQYVDLLSTQHIEINERPTYLEN